MPRPQLRLSAADREGERLRFLATLEDLWALPWENRHKDTFWRMSVNGVAGAGGHDICMAGPCPCGWHMGPRARGSIEHKRLVGAPLMRAHTFWLCSVAEAVLHELVAALPRGIHLHRMHVWLCIPPCPAVHVAVWRVVCLAAVAAMNVGRAAMWSEHFARSGIQSSDGMRQLTLQEAWDLPAAEPVVQPVRPDVYGGRVAVADFWTRLDDFVTGLPGCERPWKDSAGIPPGHAFICAVRASPGRFRLNMPAARAGPAVPVADLQGPA